MYHSVNEESTLYSVPETIRMLYNNVSFSVRCFKEIWKVGKVGRVGKVGKVGKVGEVGKVGREGLFMPTWSQL